MKAEIRGIITRAVQSTKHPERVYLDVTDLDNGGTISASTTAATAPELLKHGHLPMLIRADVQGQKFGREQSLNFKAISIAPLEAGTNGK